MPKFYYCKYLDNKWSFVWSFRKLTTADVCKTCKTISRMSLSDVIDCWSNFGKPKYIK